MAGQPPQATFLDYSVNLRIIRDCAGSARFFRLDLGASDTCQRAGQVTVAARCFDFKKTAARNPEIS